jgi:hypothetical protein
MCICVVFRGDYLVNRQRSDNAATARRARRERARAWLGAIPRDAMHEGEATNAPIETVLPSTTTWVVS